MKSLLKMAITAASALCLLYVAIAWICIAFEIVDVHRMLLPEVLLGWSKKTGWVRWYLLAGAATVASLFLMAAPSVFRGGLSMIRTAPFEFFFVAIFVGGYFIILIPVCTVGWPVVIWYVWTSRRERRSSSRPPGDSSSGL